MRVGAGRGTGVGSFYAVGAGVGAAVGDGVDTAAGDIGAERDTAFGTESGTSVVSSCQEMSMELLSPYFTRPLALKVARASLVLAKR
jgi:hypothetical protein